VYVEETPARVVRAGVAEGVVRRGGARAVLTAEERAETSEGVLPRRVILRAVRVDRARCGSGKGGRRRPGLGAMRSFWLGAGMESVLASEADRSVRVAAAGKARV